MKLKKVTLILLLILPIILVGCKKKTTDGVGMRDTDDKIPTNAQEIKESMNLSPLELAKLGKNFKCTFEMKDETSMASVSGTAYVSNNKMYSESIMELNIEDTEGMDTDPMKMSTLMADGMYYMWGSTTEEGMKMSIADMEAQKDVADEEENQYAKQMNDKIEYKCTNWIPKPSMFEVPDDITFQDIGEMVRNAQQYADEMEDTSEDMLKSMCGTCDMMPDETAKQECLVNLGCE